MTIEQTRNLIEDLFRQGPLHPVHQAAGRRVSQDELDRTALLDPGFGGQARVECLGRSVDQESADNIWLVRK